MSTILDALKKSEQERKLNKVPTLTDAPTPQEATRWPQMVIIALLIILLLVVVWFAKFWFYKGSTNSGQGSPSLVISNDTVAVVTDESAANNAIVVNVISFSQASGQSFAMINGKLYRENEFVRAGLKVEKIKRSSVILNQRGRRIEKSP